MREILTVLEADAHASVERIATLTGIDEASVREQIAAWEASGVIRKYKTVVDWDRFGDQRVTAFVDVTVAPERGRGFDDVAERIARFREIRAVHLVSGAQDLRVEVEGESMKEVADFVAQKLSGVERVTATSTHFLLRRYKDDGQLLIDPEPDQRLSVTP
ncbi:Lrp/AsnC family transcriptional regulator [Actinomycetospora endophytica]|uniref:Lrp/AsnC family transcriptional regulator n=1 Tax=Actinomycetospora endophytica TaxID=2291215 RepID=A0ABS8PLE7_9PSEU|nr:Lrp/AsnC family transcriptional regulator [Actinomycetospora endophytica]MCD2197799.1 Lrp/AsnC family transcriptional regulator [Actinomycetospora endophytica]